MTRISNVHKIVTLSKTNLYLKFACFRFLRFLIIGPLLSMKQCPDVIVIVSWRQFLHFRPTLITINEWLVEITKFIFIFKYFGLPESVDRQVHNMYLLTKIRSSNNIRTCGLLVIIQFIGPICGNHLNYKLSRNFVGCTRFFFYKMDNYYINNTRQFPK